MARGRLCRTSCAVGAPCLAPNVTCYAMSLYLIESQVPELGPLPVSLRRVAIRRALAMMRAEARPFCWLPTLLCVVGGVAGALIGADLLGHAVRLGYLQRPPAASGGDWIMLSAAWSFTGVAVGAVSAGFVGLHLQRLKLRPYLRRAIGEQAKTTHTT